jgi:hypothetical protein
LVPGEQAARGIRRLEQDVDHHGVGLQLMPAQSIQQGLHLMGQFGHIAKPESRGTALDGMGATKNPIQLLIVGRFQIEIEQHLLHQIQVLSGLLEEDLIKLG